MQHVLLVFIMIYEAFLLKRNSGANMFTQRVEILFCCLGYMLLLLLRIFPCERIAVIWCFERF